MDSKKDWKYMPAERNVNMFLQTTISKWHDKRGCKCEWTRCPGCHWRTSCIWALTSNWQGHSHWGLIGEEWERQSLRESMWEMALNPVICYQGNRWKHIYCSVSLKTKIIDGQSMSTNKFKKKKQNKKKNASVQQMTKLMITYLFEKNKKLVGL